MSPLCRIELTEDREAWTDRILCDKNILGWKGLLTKYKYNNKACELEKSSEGFSDFRIFLNLFVKLN